MKKLILSMALVLSAGNVFGLLGDTPSNLAVGEQARYDELKKKSRTPAEQKEFDDLLKKAIPIINLMGPPEGHKGPWL